MKKKRKLEDDSLDSNITKKKKKKKKAAKEEDNATVTNTGCKKRKRKESKTDWIKRQEDNSDIMQVKADKKREEEEDEPITYKKKKKKRKYEKDTKKYLVYESPAPRKKRKKKEKKREETDEEETQEFSFEYSSMQVSPLAEKRDRGEKREDKNSHDITQHTFLKPFPVQEKRGGKRDETIANLDQGSKERRGKESRGAKKREKFNSCKKKRRKEKDEAKRRKGKPALQSDEGESKTQEHCNTSDQGKQIHPTQDKHEEEAAKKRNKEEPTPQSSFTSDKDDDETQENRSTLDQEKHTHPTQQRTQDKHNKKTQHYNTSPHHTAFTKTCKLQGITSCLAYSGLYGWDTDTSFDDMDYSDDQYHQSPAALWSRVTEARRGATAPRSTVLYSEGEEVEGFVSDLSHTQTSDDEEFIPVEVSHDQRSSPGFVVKQREIPTLEEAIYTFPPGVGVPPEEVEEVDDAENYWIVKERHLQPSSYADEAKELIDDKLKYIEDYFHRLERGRLTTSELKETRPDNFDEPFYPTPCQLKFLDTLSIRVDWRLSDLHKYHLQSLTLPHKTRAQWSHLKLFADTSRFTLTEDKVIARNWFAFQKEYHFYDLRPLVSVRTARLVKEEGGELVVQPYEYLSQANKVHFLLYLAKDLPTRTLKHVNKRILKLLPFLRGRCLLRQSQPASGPMLAQLLYVMQLFGVDMLAAELLVGRALRGYYSRCFSLHIMLRDVKLRVGPWQQAEDERFLRGLREVLGVRSYEEAYRMRRVPWMAIFPYVRTRGIQYMRRRLIVLASKEGEKEHPTVMRRLMAKFIKLLCDEQVDDFSRLDWEALARQVGAANPSRLVWRFRKLYFNRIPYQRRSTVPEGLQYMYEHFLPFYEGYDPHRIPQPGDPDYQDPQNPPQANPTHDIIHDPGNLNTDSSDLSNDQINPDSDSEVMDDPESDQMNPDIESSDDSDEFVTSEIKDTVAGASNMTVNESVDSSNCELSRNTSVHRKTKGRGDNVVKDTPHENEGEIGSDKGDHRSQTVTKPRQDNQLKNIRKHNQYDPKKFLEVRSHTQEPRLSKKVINQENLLNVEQFGRSTHTTSLSQQQQIRPSTVTPMAPSRHAVDSFDLSDDDDDDYGIASSESDIDDMEGETFGEAVHKSLSYKRKK